MDHLHNENNKQNDIPLSNQAREDKNQIHSDGKKANLASNSQTGLHNANSTNNHRDTASDAPNTECLETAVTHEPVNDDAQKQQDEDSIGNVSDCEVMLVAPGPLSFYCPPGLEPLTEVCQVLVHQGNFRYPDIKVQDTPRTRFEVIDIAKKLICFIEEVEPPFGADSFLYRGYNKEKQEVLQIYSPGGSTCLFCGFSWHCLRRRQCHYQVMVQAPVGNIVGFVKRTHTWLMQEYHILSPQEEHLLTLRGGPVDLEVYTPDLETGLGRISRNWVGIMRELSRSREDYGLSFPMDLDVRVKAVLIGAVVSINWLYFKSRHRHREES